MVAWYWLLITLATGFVAGFLITAKRKEELATWEKGHIKAVYAKATSTEKDVLTKIEAVRKAL